MKEGGVARVVVFSEKGGGGGVEVSDESVGWVGPNAGDVVVEVAVDVAVDGSVEGGATLAVPTPTPTDPTPTDTCSSTYRANNASTSFNPYVYRIVGCIFHASNGGCSRYCRQHAARNNTDDCFNTPNTSSWAGRAGKYKHHTSDNRYEWCIRRLTRFQNGENVHVWLCRMRCKHSTTSSTRGPCQRWVAVVGGWVSGSGDDGVVVVGVGGVVSVVVVVVVVGVGVVVVTDDAGVCSL